VRKIASVNVWDKRISPPCNRRKAQIIGCIATLCHFSQLFRLQEDAFPYIPREFRYLQEDADEMIRNSPIPCFQVVDKK
jgi:hypothetical protein